jgi:transcriptional antiterminator RfaH
MNSLGVSEVPRWHVIRSHSRQEERAELNLQRGQIETFLPWVRPRPSARTKSPQREALFPQYLFAKFDPQARLHDIGFTRGVQGIVKIGGELAIVDDEVIECLRSWVDEQGFVPMGQKIEPGMRVVVEAGPFAELVGIVERTLPAQQRAIVLLTIIGCSKRVVLPADHLRHVTSN